MLDFNDVGPQHCDEPPQQRLPASECYVPTAAARQAVEGRETEILDKLGIAWSTREKHIRCPLGTHADNNPSWRWDQREACYYCSCSSGSIFNVLMKVERLGDGDDAFDAAKIRAVELIGRADLIVDPNAEKPKAEGLTLEAYAEAKRLPVDELFRVGVRNCSYGRVRAISTPYIRMNGDPSIRYRVNLNGDKNKRYYWRKGDKACLYGEWYLDHHEFLSYGYVVLVEGESDCQTCWFNGSFPALGLPGAGQWNEERYAPLLANIPTVFVVIEHNDQGEPDSGGKVLLQRIARSSIASRVRLVRLPDGTKDPSALCLKDPAGFTTAFRTALDAAQPIPPELIKEAQAEKPPAAAHGASLTKPIVRIHGGDLPEVVDDAERALIKYDHGIFQRGDFLVRAAPSIINISDNRKTTGTRLIRIGKHHLVERLTQFVDFQKYNAQKEDYVSIDAPEKVALTYLARVGAWGVRVLTGVTDCPTLRTDGSVLDQPGYDVPTGILYQPRGIDYPPIPTRPTKDDAVLALAQLKSIIEEFKFLDDASRSVTLSGFLTAPIRRSIPSSPMHAFTAPVAGSGKSMLVDIASLIASGHEAPVITPGETREESEKRLGSQLLAGDAVVSFDNCDGPLSSALLCQVLTQANVKIRILGKSETPTVPNNALIFSNGNNLVLVGDLTRRAIRGSLDPKCERPELRTFKTADLIGAVKRNRAQLLVACLTILRAFDEAGRPSQGAPLGSFETWWHWVRGALVWLDEADPCETMEKVRQDDPKRQAIENVLTHWKAVLGAEEVTTKQIIDRATDLYPSQPDTDFNKIARREFMFPEFRDALMVVAADRGLVDAQRLGFWLRSVKGRIINDMRIAQGLRERSWKLEEVRS